MFNNSCEQWDKQTLGCFGFFCSALTQANTTVQIVHEGPVEAGGCFLDLRPPSLKKDVVSSSELREGIFHLYGRKEGRGRMSRKGAAPCRAPKAKDDEFELQAGDSRWIFWERSEQKDEGCSLCAEISGKGRDPNMFVFLLNLNHCQPEKLLHKYVIVGLTFINV